MEHISDAKLFVYDIIILSNHRPVNLQSRLEQLAIVSREAIKERIVCGYEGIVIE
jgi:hypothetical protein